MENSPFSRLPIELRLRLYELVLQHGSNVLIGAENYAPEWLTKLLDLPPSPDGPGEHWWPRQKCDYLPTHFLSIAQTCHKMRQESLPVFYSINNFHINVHPPTHRLSSFVGDIGGDEISVAECFNELILPVQQICHALEKIHPRGTTSITVHVKRWVVLSYRLQSNQSAELLRNMLTYLDNLRKSKSDMLHAVHFAWEFVESLDDPSPHLPKFRVCAQLDDKFEAFTRGIERFAIPPSQEGVPRNLPTGFIDWCQQAGLTLRNEPDFSFLEQS